MLKIINNVDLKKLEEFGFKYCPKQRNYKEHYCLKNTKDYFYPRDICYVTCEDRQIGVSDTWEIDIIYDLIQSGLVEKVRGGNDY